MEPSAYTGPPQGSKTVRWTASVSRAAITATADPPPTMTTSTTSVELAMGSPSFSHRRWFRTFRGFVVELLICRVAWSHRLCPLSGHRQPDQVLPAEGASYLLQRATRHEIAEVAPE